MPYIKQEDRDKLDQGLSPTNAGELNYALHIILEQYLYNKGESYQTYNDMVGALESAKMELYRRQVAKYEDEKITLNGDIEFYRDK